MFTGLQVALPLSLIAVTAEMPMGGEGLGVDDDLHAFRHSTGVFAGIVAIAVGLVWSR